MTKPTFTEFFRAVWMEVQFQRGGSVQRPREMSRAEFARCMGWVRRVSF